MTICRFQYVCMNSWSSKAMKSIVFQLHFALWLWRLRFFFKFFFLSTGGVGVLWGLSCLLLLFCEFCILCTYLVHSYILMAVYIF